MVVRGLRLFVVAAGAVGGLSGATYGLLNGQSRHARSVIGVPTEAPLNADGVYFPDGRYTPGGEADLTFAVFGDSSAAGVGAETTELLPGALLARGLAEEMERSVRLVTYAVSGATTPALTTQVNRALAAHRAPDLALVIVGGNDVTARLRVGVSAALLGEEVRRLRDAGTAVVVGTCPDLGAIRPIPQPLRSVARGWSLSLARAQRREVERMGATAVAMADLLSPEFLTRATEFFSPDLFHPNGAGYEMAANVLLAPLCAAAGMWPGGPLPTPPSRAATAEARRPTARVVSWLNGRLMRKSW